MQETKETVRKYFKPFCEVSAFHQQHLYMKALSMIEYIHGNPGNRRDCQ